jgi:3-oxoacyl-[acyl-carrier protein] reductase
MVDLLIFGGTGALGRAIIERFVKGGARVWCVCRQVRDEVLVHEGIQYVPWDPLATHTEFPQVLSGRKFAAVVWAQGMNALDDIYSFDRALHEKIYTTNVTYILQSLKFLLDNDSLDTNAKLCIVSSIWQELGRPRKLSYTVSKAAIAGLVRSLAVDLGIRGITVNAVLPGVIDTPMTRANLSMDQIRVVEGMTPLSSLATSEEVGNTIFFLCSSENGGITGEFFTVDRGFSSARIL